MVRMRSQGVETKEVGDAPLASFLRAMSMNCLMSRISLGWMHEAW